MSGKTVAASEVGVIQSTRIRLSNQRRQVPGDDGARLRGAGRRRQLALLPRRHAATATAHSLLTSDGGLQPRCDAGWRSGTWVRGHATGGDARGRSTARRFALAKARDRIRRCPRRRPLDHGQYRGSVQSGGAERLAGGLCLSIHGSERLPVGRRVPNHRAQRLSAGISFPSRRSERLSVGRALRNDGTLDFPARRRQGCWRRASDYA